MKNMNVVIQGMLRGKEEIDRMKREIETIVGIILNLLRNEKPPNVFEPAFFPFKKCEWKIEAIRERKGFEISCWVGQCREIAALYSINECLPFSFKSTQLIHESLPVFVEGVMKTFPEIEKRWQYLLNAAEKANEPNSERIFEIAFIALIWRFKQLGTEKFMGEMKAVAEDMGIPDGEMFEFFKVIAEKMKQQTEEEV